MMRFVLLACALLVLTASEAAQAQRADLPSCVAFRTAWNRVSVSNDLAALDAGIARIPADSCPNLRGEALARRTVVANQAASVSAAEANRAAADARRAAADRARSDAESRAYNADYARQQAESRLSQTTTQYEQRLRDAATAATAARDQAVRDQIARDQTARDQAVRDATDDGAWAVAQRANTTESYNAYLGLYSAGRHSSAANTAKSSLRPIQVSICNRSGRGPIDFAYVYLPVGESRWRHRGWYRVEDGQCSLMFETRNQTFYVRGLAANSSWVWGTGSTQCFTNEAFDFFTCPPNARNEGFYQESASVTSGPYTWTASGGS